MRSLLIIVAILIMLGCNEENITVGAVGNEEVTTPCASNQRLDVTSTNTQIITAISDGYTDKLSYGVGEKVDFFVNGTVPMSARVPIYDVNNTVVDFANLEIVKQKKQASDAFMQGYTYCKSGFYQPSKNLISGLYFLANKIPFVFKGDVLSKDASIVVVYPTNTIAAYEQSGGGGLYTYDSNKKSNSQVSFLRPMPHKSYNAEGFLRWMKLESGFEGNTRYISDMDLDDYTNLSDAKVLIIIGHSEYWTRLARLNFDRFVDEGHHAIVLSGNTMWWQVRYSDDKKKLICYKASSNVGTTDPEKDVLLQTKNWFITSLDYPILNSLGVDFRYAGYGVHGVIGDKVPKKNFGGFKVVNDASPLLAGTSLKSGDVLSLYEDEVDGSPISGFDPNGVPIIDTSIFSPYRINILGYDYSYFEAYYQSLILPLSDPSVQVWTPNGGLATWIVWQKKPQSGFIMNGAAEPGWTYAKAFLNDDNSMKIKKIIRNTISIFLRDEDPFVK